MGEVELRAIVVDVGREVRGEKATLVSGGNCGGYG